MQEIKADNNPHKPTTYEFDLATYACRVSEDLGKARKRNKQLVYSIRALFALNLIWIAIFIYIWLMLG